MKIAHLTTVHPRTDSRIRLKEVASLAKAFDAEVELYVQDGLGDEADVAGGYKIIDTGPRLRRLSRMTKGAWRMISAVRRARPTVAHFHDPELLPWAMILKLWGIKVVYDVHEDVPRQVGHNPGLPPLAQKVLPPFVSLTEWLGGRLLDGVVVATPAIAARFPERKTIVVKNFPLVHELHAPDPPPMKSRPLEFAYVGTITSNRNIFAMIDAVSRLPHPEARLRLAGAFSIEADQRQAEKMPGWAHVRFEGWTSREGVAAVMADARAGLVVLKPVAHEMLTLPIKLFEYMAAGLPLISSDFPLWREIIDRAGCGLLVDPEDTAAIVAAMQWILDNPDEAQAMGERGRRAVLEEFDWNLEAASLVAFYREGLGLRDGRPATRS